jgi:hypothetical protein
MSIRQTSSVLYDAIGGILQIASVMLGIATIYLIRSDLLKHYNEREPIGLCLGGVPTWFFPSSTFSRSSIPSRRKNIASLTLPPVLLHQS